MVVTGFFVLCMFSAYMYQILCHGTLLVSKAGHQFMCAHYLMKAIISKLLFSTVLSGAIVYHVVTKALLSS